MVHLNYLFSFFFFFLTSCENRDDTHVTVFHPVKDNIAMPSHVKRFSMRMFTFTNNNEVLRDQVIQAI